MKKLIWCCLLFALIIGCDDNNESEPELLDFIVVDTSNETEWDYWIAEKNGGYTFIDENNSIPQTIFFKPNSFSSGYSIFLDNLGYPEKVVINDNIFLFTYFNESMIDLAIFTPGGEVFNQRNNDSGLNWNNSIFLDNSNNPSINDRLNWIGKALKAITLVINTVSKNINLGLTPTQTGYNATITNIIVSLGNSWDFIDTNAKTLNPYTTIVGCSSHEGESCLLELSSMAFSMKTTALTFISNNQFIISDIPAGISSFLTTKNIETLTELGLTFNKGFNPPLIDGYYYADNLKNLNTSSRYIEYWYYYHDQRPNNTINMQEKSSVSISIGNNGFISGNGNYFTAYFEENSENTDQTNDHIVTIRKASIYSGEITASGIKDFIYGFIILDKENDDNNHYMNVGEARIIYESDNLAEKVDDFPNFSSSLKSSSTTRQSIVDK